MWATHPVDVMTVAGDRKMEKLRGKQEDYSSSKSHRRLVRAFVDKRGVLKLVRVLEGSGAEVVVFSMPVSKLPAVLSPWPFARVSEAPF